MDPDRPHPGLLAGDPTAVGPVHLTGRLGSGGMSTVYVGELPGHGEVAVKVFDLKGRFVTTLVDLPYQEVGSHSVPWDGLDRTGRDLPAGVYFVQLRVGSEIENLRVMLVK